MAAEVHSAGPGRRPRCGATDWTLLAWNRDEVSCQACLDTLDRYKKLKERSALARQVMREAARRREET